MVGEERQEKENIRYSLLILLAGLAGAPDDLGRKGGALGSDRSSQMRRMS
jgi:hypothetical protein